ncbi:MAG: carboxypeptidase-like regulatory domain-containing protein, partial [Candidatus Solibacter sp.]
MSKFLCLICFLALSFPGSLVAQFSSAIQGSVTDASGGAVANASVTVTHLATGVVRNVTTLEDGGYRVLSLAPGKYRVTIEKAGFRTANRDSITLDTTETIRADFALELGVVSDRITVTGARPLVETEQGRVSG